MAVELRGLQSGTVPRVDDPIGVLVALGRKDEAAGIYRKGMETATEKRDFHARSELEAAMAELEGSGPDAG